MNRRALLYSKSGKITNHIGEKTAIKLTELGFGARMSAKILKTYQDQALHVIEKDPYRLVMDIEGIGFQ